MALWMVFSLQSVVFLALEILEVAAGKATISPSYVWPLRYIYNKTIPVVPPLAVHGDVVKRETSLQFDGKSSWLDAGELSGSCISQPQNCINGLSIAIRIKLENVSKSQSPRFFFDSGGYNGEGVSLYLLNDQLFGQVADKKRAWKVSSEIPKDAWHFVLLTWSVNDGLLLFMNGPMKGQSSQPVALQVQPVATSKHVIIGKCNAANENTFASFSSDLMAIFDSVTPDGKVYLSYSFSSPTTRGNIRYVNAKFINSADFDLIIFPDRGEHQTTGYQLEARSSTLLEYVLREGPLPIGMSFRLQNKKNGEQLTFNGKDNLHVVSSDDKQVVNSYKIQPDASIKLLTSTSGVSIDYQIKPAQVNPEQEIQTTGSMPTEPVNKTAAKPPQVNNLLTDNPEIPDDEETAGNTTVVAPTTPSQTTKSPNLPLLQTSTIPPTIPPPPEPSAFSKPPITLTPNKISESNANETQSGSNTTRPSYNATGFGSNATEVVSNATESGSNATNVVSNATESGSNATNVVSNATEPGSNATNVVSNATESGSNATNVVSNATESGSNATSTSGGKISSPEMPEEDEQLNGIEVGNGTALNISSGGDLEIPTENGTSGQMAGNISTGNQTIGNLTNETIGNLTNVNLANETMGNLTKGNTSTNEGNKTEKAGPKEPENTATAPVSSINQPNPWIAVAKQIQQQQQQQLKPIPWENGQGAYDAIHSISKWRPEEKQNGVSPINYKLDKQSRLTNKPVWQYINGRPVTGEWFGESQHLAEQQTPGTSPFKFANAKTQQQAKAYYFENKPTTMNSNAIDNDKLRYVKTSDDSKEKQVL